MEFTLEHQKFFYKHQIIIDYLDLEYIYTGVTIKKLKHLAGILIYIKIIQNINS